MNGIEKGTKKENMNTKGKRPGTERGTEQGTERGRRGKERKGRKENPRERASTAPTSPDMMRGGRFHQHVMEMDELRRRQVSTRSSASTRSAGYATSQLVQSVFSSPSAPRARQILRRGEY